MFGDYARGVGREQALEVLLMRVHARSGSQAAMCLAAATCGMKNFGSAQPDWRLRAAAPANVWLPSAVA
jgi:hypothetical protein